MFLYFTIPKRNDKNKLLYLMFYQKVYLKFDLLVEIEIESYDKYFVYTITSLCRFENKLSKML